VRVKIVLKIMSESVVTAESLFGDPIYRVVSGNNLLQAWRVMCGRFAGVLFQSI